jgi:hypothetical protein
MTKDAGEKLPAYIICSDSDLRQRRLYVEIIMTIMQDA